MPSNVSHLPVTHRQTPAVEPDRGEWGALRAELHDRCNDQDLATLWAELAAGERRALMASARLVERDPRLAIHDLPKPSRDALRAAIHRMSQYAAQLRDSMNGHRPHKSRELAAHARQALADGNTEAALHWLAIIERGVA
ncbi:hypothetical protein FIU88_05650 [Halomonas sp. THAF12]|uniref:hypothetical protein n=1 Tax=Halomonas sp. THAF12 TaxID=2587849 RepID=UPI0012678A4D|nr:hypothetical protein [Halomonas sp. THAF12]QFT84463.1 hypothetical protein FIU88_05650 [Halomonas sp. THAF12]